MRQSIFHGILAVSGLAFLTNAVPAYARVAAPPPVPFRVQQADCLIIGRVIAVQDQDVQVKVSPNGQAVKYRVAVVAVTEAIKGAKGKKTIRVGYIPPPPSATKPPIRGRGYRYTKLTSGMHGLFYLKKIKNAKFFAMAGPAYFDFVSSQNKANFNSQVQLAKLAVKVSSDPIAALTGKISQERYMAAVMRLEQFRRPSGKPPYKQVPIDAKENKLILDALLNAQWKAGSTGPYGGRMHPYYTFIRLGLTPADGWKQPVRVRNVQEYYDAAQAWLKKHSGSYRIKKYVGN